MKTDQLLPSLRLLSAAVFATLISSCALPPREAMRIVQRDGLIPFLAGDYSSYSGNQSYASAAPFQPNRPYVAPRPVNPIPYRSTYHTNRYTRADYDRVPYRPKTVTRSSSQRHSSSHTSSAPRVTKTPEKPVVKSDTASAKPSSTAPSADAPKKPVEALPYGAPVVGRPGMVTSPFAKQQQLVDVTGLAPGDTVKDPYSGKLFRVPPTQQAAAETKPAADAPAKSADKAESSSKAEAPAPDAPAAPKP